MVTTKHELLLKEKFVEITLDPESKSITAKWMGFLKSDEVKKACLVLSASVKKYAVAKHLSDQTQMKVMSKEIQEFVAGNVLPELESLGLRKMAVLVADDVFAQAAANNVHTKAKIGKLSINTYNSLPQCENWLNEK